MPELLVVEDEPVAREGLERLLRLEGYGVRAAGSAEEALSIAAGHPPHIVVTSLRLPTMSGLDLIDALEARGFVGPVLVLSALPTIEQAVQAIRRGAADYLRKPVNLDRLMARIEDLWAELEVRGAEHLAEVDGRVLVGSSAPMQRLVEAIRMAAHSDATVLVEGETGTGKELIARLVHSWSARKAKPFVPLHCAALAEGVLESELFGHERGAFTGAVRERQGRFEMADHGTLFLDELGEMGPQVQVKLLRVLEDGTFERVGGSRSRSVDVRLVSATHRDLRGEVAAGRFREDLFYRLNVIPLRIPPLRERRGDIPLLARAFVKKYAEKYQKRVLGFTRDALEALEGHAWPGNVRELESLVERAVVFARGSRVERGELPPPLDRIVDGPVQAQLTLPVGISLKDALRPEDSL
jgi:DNA-binding NtrC family response regulator